MNLGLLLGVQAILLFCGLGLAAPAARAEKCEDPAVLRFSTIPKSNAEQLQAYGLLTRELERALGRRVEVVRSNSYGAVVEGLRAGHIDVAELGPASYALLMERGAFVVAFAALSSGPQGKDANLSTYRSVLAVRKDSGYQSLAALRGKTVSLTDPVSTSGALLPMQAVRELTGQTMETYFSRITYAGSHSRALEAVRKGLVDAAFVSSSRLTQYSQQTPPPAVELTMLWQSAPIPTDPYVHRSRLCNPLVQRIRKVFFESPQALRAFYDAMGDKRFVPASDADYKAIRQAIALQPPARLP